MIRGPLGKKEGSRLVLGQGRNGQELVRMVQFFDSRKAMGTGQGGKGKRGRPGLTPGILVPKSEGSPPRETSPLVGVKGVGTRPGTRA